MTVSVDPAQPRVLTPDNVKKFAGLTVVKSSTVKEMGFCACIYGPGGAGKTTLLAGLDKCEHASPLLYCDAEGGISSVGHLDVDTIMIQKWTDLQQVAEGFKSAPPGQMPYRSVVFDNLTEIQAINVRHVVPGGGAPSQPEWNTSTLDMLRFIRFWRDLSRFTGLNVFFTAWDMPAEGAGGYSKRAVGFTPSLARQFPGIMTYIGYLDVEQGGLRHLSFAPGPRTDAKFRCSPDEAAAKIPLDMWYPLKDNPMVDMLAVVKGGAQWPTQKYVKPGSRQT